MIYTLENENIRVVASSNGGELHSIKKINDETEYLWNGDERYWKYHAPVLFPIVGKVMEVNIKLMELNMNYRNMVLLEQENLNL